MEDRSERSVLREEVLKLTAITVGVPMPRTPGISEVSQRIGGLLNERRLMAQWWVDLAGELDELSVRLLTDGEEVWRGLSDQLTRDAPHMSSQLRRLDAEHEALADELLKVRILAGQSAGDPSLKRTVADAVRTLLSRLRRLEERTAQVLYEAYERDLGGESA